MRYLGNKETLVDNILSLLDRKGLCKRGLTFFDAFCGMGSVSSAVSDIYDKILINDILKACTTFTKGRILSSKTMGAKLNFDPVEYLNNSTEKRQDFFFHNYSPGGSHRMYFTAENAERIDYFRWQIEEWKNNGDINEEYYVFLLACLLESVSKVSNTAGVYGAFLKKWDNRALKPIQFVTVASDKFFSEAKVMAFNDRLENIVANIDCDIIYLDPPYTQNQYGTQYHLLETLVLNDEPSISKVTGSRPVTPMRSDWSVKHKCHILFDKVIAETKAKHILLSYNNDGLMTKDFIESTLKRYGKEETYECEVIKYKKYLNHKSKESEGHCEYLFYIEKKDREEVIESPLNYTGSKSKMIEQIKSLLPKDIDTFVDVFGGGFNVGINIHAKHIIYNDINPFVVGLMRSFAEYDTYNYLSYIENVIEKYGLSPLNRDAYIQLREEYNNIDIDKRDPKMLYTLILYGFQQQIRFNGSHNFNNPAGSRWFNDKLMSKFVSFARVSRYKQQSISFQNSDFTEILDNMTSDCFLYLDPPYLSTTGAYNDGKRGFQGWTREHEEKLCAILDNASEHGAKFMLSYIFENNDFFNESVYSWALKNNYNIVNVAEPQGKYNNRKEVLIFNYQTA